MKYVLLLALMSACVLLASAETYLKETFSDRNWAKSWRVSDFKQKEGQAGKWKWSAGTFPGHKERAKGLQTTEDLKFYAISTELTKPLKDHRPGSTLVVQFTVKHQQGLMPACGGGYLKLLKKTDPKGFNNESPYVLSFGPDICGTQTRHIKVNVNAVSENKAFYYERRQELRCETDRLTHVYTLVMEGDTDRGVFTSYKVLVDGMTKGTGNFDFEDDKEWGLTNSSAPPTPPDFQVWDATQLGFELWQVKAGSIFDNIIITSDPDEAQAMLDAEWPAQDRKKEEEQLQSIREREEEEYRRTTAKINEQRQKQDARLASKENEVEKEERDL